MDRNYSEARLEEALTPGRDQKQIIIPDAPSGDYVVRVWSCVEIVDSKNHRNEFEPPPTVRTGQPEGFVPGRVTDWFSVLFDGNDLTWLLDGHAVNANRNLPRCR